MKFVDEFRNAEIAQDLAKKIGIAMEAIARPVSLMEVCGTHTMSIFRHGIKNILPPSVKLLSGPGCPVCVTPPGYIDRAMAFSQQEGVIVCSFGDMLNVPGTCSCLSEERARGAEVRDVYSPLDALKIALQNPDKKIIFIAVGFETTAPAIAGTIMEAKEKGASNFFISSAHKLIPPAMKLLVDDDEVNIDGFICPAHVSAIIGAEAYRFLASDCGVPCVITGFEPLDILQGILMLLNQITESRPDVEIQYSRIVKKQGNTTAMNLVSKVFAETDSVWRGLGIIAKSGLEVAELFSQFDANKEFQIEIKESEAPSGCICGDILKGKKEPKQCSLFRKTCTPSDPVGPCMVSQEGTCAAHYRYGDI